MVLEYLGSFGVGYLGRKCLPARTPYFQFEGNMTDDKFESETPIHAFSYILLKLLDSHDLAVLESSFQKSL